MNHSHPPANRINFVSRRLIDARDDDKGGAPEC